MFSLIKDVKTLTAKLANLTERSQEMANTLSSCENTIDWLSQSLVTVHETNTVILKALEDCVSRNVKLDDELTELKATVTEMAKRDQNTNVPDMLKYGSEPWFNLVGGEYDTSKGVKLNIDWNTAFIDQLRSQGYTGLNEHQVVAQWLAAVSAATQNNLGAD